MRSTDTQALPFPDCEDPGAGALQLQVLAEAIDAKLVAHFAAYRAIVNRPAFIVGLNVLQTGFASGSPGSPVIWERVLFNSAITGDPIGSSAVLFYQPGYWLVGAYLSSIPSGGVTANSEIHLELKYRGDLVAPIGGSILETWATTNFQSNTGGEHQVSTALVRQEFDDLTSFSGGGSLTLNVRHENVASTVNVNTATLMWGFKVCELEDM